MEKNIDTTCRVDAQGNYACTANLKQFYQSPYKTTSLCEMLTKGESSKLERDLGIMSYYLNTPWIPQEVCGNLSESEFRGPKPQPRS